MDFDQSQIDADIEARIESVRRAREAFLAIGDAYVPAEVIAAMHAIEGGDRPHRFNVLSLDAWSAVADLAGVEIVPLEKIGAVRADEILAAFDGKESDATVARLTAFAERIRAEAPAKLPRWDFAASQRIKSRLAAGEALDASDCNLGIGDMRIGEQLLDYPERTVPLFLRPWIQARTRPGRDGGSYPCEWRVFVDTSKDAPLAASNYYPQAPAEDRPEERAGAARALSQAGRIVDALRRHGLEPHHPRHATLGAEDGQIRCTLDFLERPDGSVLLIEGGPGPSQVWGADPCCFPAAPLISGVALAAD